MATSPMLHGESNARLSFQDVLGLLREEVEEEHSSL